METFLVLLPLCVENLLATTEIPHKVTVNIEFWRFFFASPNKLLNKRYSYRWFETPWTVMVFILIFEVLFHPNPIGKSLSCYAYIMHPIADPGVVPRVSPSHPFTVRPAVGLFTPASLHSLGSLESDSLRCHHPVSTSDNKHIYDNVDAGMKTL